MVFTFKIPHNSTGALLPAGLLVLLPLSGHAAHNNGFADGKPGWDHVASCALLPEHNRWIRVAPRGLADLD